MTVAIARMSATAHTTPTGSHMSLTVARFRPLRAAETGVRGLQLRFDRLREEPDCDGSESQDGLTGDNHELILPLHVVAIAEWTQMNRAVGLDEKPVEFGVEPSSTPCPVKTKALPARRW